MLSDLATNDLDNVLRKAIDDRFYNLKGQFKKLERVVSNILIINGFHSIFNLNQSEPDGNNVQPEDNSFEFSKQYTFRKEKDNFCLLSAGLLQAFGRRNTREYIFVTHSKKIINDIDKNNFIKYTKEDLINIYNKTKAQYKDPDKEIGVPNHNETRFVNKNFYDSPLEQLNDNFVFYVDRKFVDLVENFFNKSFNDILFYKNIHVSRKGDILSLTYEI